eukprot:755349-Rhodomonas_salina.1
MAQEREGEGPMKRELRRREGHSVRESRWEGREARREIQEMGREVNGDGRTAQGGGGKRVGHNCMSVPESTHQGHVRVEMVSTCGYSSDISGATAAL